MGSYIGSLKNFIKENKLLSLIVFGALVVIVAISLYSGDSQKVSPAVTSEAVSQTFGQLPPAPRIPSSILPATPSATANFLDPLKTALPATARVYACSQTSTLSLDKVDKLAVKLGFKNKPSVLPNGKYNWDEGGAFLHYDATLDGAVFGGLPVPFSPLTPVSKAETAKLLLDSVGLSYPDLVFSDNNPIVTGEGVSTFLIPRVIDNLEVSSLPFDPALVSFDFNSAGGITGGVYYYHGLQSGAQSYGVYPLKTAEEAVSALMTGQGSLAELGISGYEAVDITGITAISVTSIKLLYHEAREPAKFLRPVYSLSGTASLQDGRTTTATYFVDALK